MFDRKNAQSTIRKAPATAALAARLHCHTSRIAMNSSALVISIVADTAMP